jgi:hypothetical protein
VHLCVRVFVYARMSVLVSVGVCVSVHVYACTSTCLNFYCESINPPYTILYIQCVRDTVDRFYTFLLTK